MKYAEGSVLIEMGQTKVICSASVEDRVPPFLRNSGKGWITAEYSMLPYSTLQRKVRESTKGRIEGRSQEIQRLIGRSLRSVIDLQALGERDIYGYRFPERLHKNEPLPQPIITPPTKADAGGHDERLTCAQVVEQGYLDARTWEQAQQAALATPDHHGLERGTHAIQPSGRVFAMRVINLFLRKIQHRLGQRA